MTVLFVLLASAILGALVIGQVRLIWHAMRSGRAGFGRFAAEKSSASVHYWLWVAIYLGFLVYVSTLLLASVTVVAREFLA